LNNNGIKALSKLHNGTTARTFLGWVDDNHVKVLRIPKPDHLRPDSFNVTRLNTPIMAQPYDKYWVANHVIEILPFVPVLPNIGLNAVDSLPGHSNIHFGTYVFAGNNGDGVTFRAEEHFGLDRDILTYAALLRVVGYKLEAPRDIGITANGSPIFVDPGTLDMMTPYMQDIAFKKLCNGFKELEVDDLFSWEQSDTSKALHRQSKRDGFQPHIR
jgi:hypothetical protein